MGVRSTIDDLYARRLRARLRRGRLPRHIGVIIDGNRSGFLLWQAKNARLYFCDVYWPGFRYLDLLRALRVHAQKNEPPSRPRLP